MLRHDRKGRTFSKKFSPLYTFGHVLSVDVVVTSFRPSSRRLAVSLLRCAFCQMNSIRSSSRRLAAASPFSTTRCCCHRCDVINALPLLANLRSVAGSDLGLEIFKVVISLGKPTSQGEPSDEERWRRELASQVMKKDGAASWRAKWYHDFENFEPQITACYIPRKKNFWDGLGKFRNGEQSFRNPISESWDSENLKNS